MVFSPVIGTVMLILLGTSDASFNLITSSIDFLFKAFAYWQISGECL